MNMPANPVPLIDPRTLLKTLQEGFSVFRESKPLAIGIDKQLLARVPGIDRKALRIALGMHTHSTRYLKSTAKAGTRFDLDGNAAEELSDAHRQHAAEMLRERVKKDADRRKAQQELEISERKREAEERQRTEKLGQLVARFGRTN